MIDYFYLIPIALGLGMTGSRPSCGRSKAGSTKISTAPRSGYCMRTPTRRSGKNRLRCKSENVGSMHFDLLCRCASNFWLQGTMWPFTDLPVG